MCRLALVADVQKSVREHVRLQRRLKNSPFAWRAAAGERLALDG